MWRCGDVAMWRGHERNGSSSLIDWSIDSLARALALVNMGSCESRLNHWLSYTTVKLVDIHNWKLGGFHYLVQLLILVYVLVYVVWYDNGYQGVSQVVGQVSIKPKGSALQSVPGQPPLVWDATDIGTLRRCSMSPSIAR